MSTAAGHLTCSSSPAPTAGSPSRAFEDLLLAFDQLPASSEPVAVFTAVTVLCVPALGDRCRVTIHGEDDPRTGLDQAPSQRPVSIDQPAPRRPASAVVEYPPGGVTADCDIAWAHGSMLVTAFDVPARTDHARYHGELLTGWGDGRVASDYHAALARLIVNQAVAVVFQARAADAARRAETHNAHLRKALGTNREIGIALGIIMTTLHTTLEPAFELMRMTSQSSNRKIRDIADDIVHDGGIGSISEFVNTFPTDRPAVPVAPTAPFRARATTIRATRTIHRVVRSVPPPPEGSDP